MTCEDIDELRSEVNVLMRHVHDLENNRDKAFIPFVNNTNDEIRVLKRAIINIENHMWAPVKPECGTYYNYQETADEVRKHFNQNRDKHLEKCLREHIEKRSKK
jgi:hypothetical protein